jgi:hypothetical protein
MIHLGDSAEGFSEHHQRHVRTTFQYIDKLLSEAGHTMAEYDLALLEFLSLYANRLRRWMEQSIAALRKAFNAFADMYRARFESAPATLACADSSAVEHDLQILREWNAANHGDAVAAFELAVSA